MLNGFNTMLRSFAIFLSLAVFGIAADSAWAQNPSPSPTPARRPLPKPPAGTRGFEKYAGQDASSRLIAAGATRGVHPRQPVAPLEGAAYDPYPFFAWEIEPQSRTYRFSLYEGDVEKDPAAPIVYQADVKALELRYPKEAKELKPGKVYSWRVSTPTPTGMEEGPAARIVILSGADLAEVKQALETAKLTAPKTAADKLDQARVFENFGVWYDALRVASELAQDPNDKEAQAYFDELLDKLDSKSEP